MNSSEREVVVLSAVFELIDTIVNFEMLVLGDTDPTTIRFKSATHAKFFNIVLVDLLSFTDPKGLVESTPYLRALDDITGRPSFDFEGSIASLRESTNRFTRWLQAPIVIDSVWLPSINLKTNLELTRLELVKTAGNICRHNVLRAAGIANDVRRLLQRGGTIITVDQALLALSDLYEWLHTDVFHYHSSTIAEFLNDLRWGIYRYLQPEYERSLVVDESNPRRYGYTYPTSIASEFAKECYWDLMNDIRSPPHMRQFQVDEMLKLQY